MTGLIHVNPMTKEAITRHMSRCFPDGMFPLEKFEDMSLATPARSKYADIGMGEIDKDMFIYALTNLPWINICLFVNDDFRECFCDAVMIEKALLQVSRREYLEFRDEMTMDGDSDLPAASIAVNFASFSQEIDSAIGTLIAQGYTLLVGSGTHEAYDLLLKELSGDALEKTGYVVYHLVYLINALRHNGVFRKYVTIVVENVKKQLVSNYNADAGTQK